MKAVHFLFSVSMLPVIAAGVNDEDHNKGVRETITEAVVGDCNHTSSLLAFDCPSTGVSLCLGVPTPPETIEARNLQQLVNQAQCMVMIHRKLHYIDANDTGPCHTNVHFRKYARNIPSIEKGDPTFTETGYSSWKRATEAKAGFIKHENYVHHKNFTYCLIFSSKSKDIAKHELDKRCVRKKYSKILSSICFLTRQGLLFRGSDDDKGKLLLAFDSAIGR